jgi:hypothetical protein
MINEDPSAPQCINVSDGSCARSENTFSTNAAGLSDAAMETKSSVGGEMART